MITGDMEYEDLIGLTEILGWKNITTKRQKKNGTTIYRLPIKKYGQFIEVGSFESGYVRRMNGCYTPYQLNKCKPSVTYYKDYDHIVTDYGWEQKFTGKYNKFVGKSRVLIDNEVDRLEYLIAFCLKNYYINQANMIEEGKFVPKWKHEYEMQNGSIDKVRELQNELRRNNDLISVQRARIEELEEKLDGINGMSVDAYNNGYNDGKQEPEVSVTVNGHRYKVI